MPVVAAKLVSCWVFEKRKDSMLQVTGEEREAYIFTDEAAVVVLSVQREDAIDHAKLGSGCSTQPSSWGWGRSSRIWCLCCTSSAPAWNSRKYLG